MMNPKKISSFLLLLVFLFSLSGFMPERAEAARKRPRKKVARKYPRRWRRSYRRRAPKRAFQEYYLNPAVRMEERQALVERLTELGIKTAKFNKEGSTLYLQFEASKVSAVDIMQNIKDAGHTVTNIN